MIDVVVLDAMGVLYVDADDVGRVLLPFLAAKGLTTDRSVVEPLYLRCSSGEFGTDDLWRRLGASDEVGALDDEYVRGYTLNAGVDDFLERMAASNRRVAALTNDTSEWSLRLRRRFELEHRIDPWIVSGDVGHRKPDPEIYRHLLASLPDVAAENVLFVDDRAANLDAAAAFGISTVRFGGSPSGDHHVVDDFRELRAFVDER